ncbi:MAG: hypothetical protein WC444_07520 [Candidatus Paceibacterota bacterium]
MTENVYTEIDPRDCLKDASANMPTKICEVVDKLDSDELKVVLQEQAAKQLEQSKTGSDKSDA